ncbi:MAG: gamma-glutamylcyclotransferase family protein [Microcoleaceae cyanobacterium]
MLTKLTQTEPIHVFVYGTLKPGEINYQRYCAHRQVQSQSAIAQGRLFNLSLGYPAMTQGEAIIQGVVLTFTDRQLLTELDELEGYHPNHTVEENEYHRQQILVYTPEGQGLGQVWAYWMEFEKIQALGGIEILTGCWNS